MRHPHLLVIKYTIFLWMLKILHPFSFSIGYSGVKVACLVQIPCYMYTNTVESETNIRNIQTSRMLTMACWIVRLLQEGLIFPSSSLENGFLFKWADCTFVYFDNDTWLISLYWECVYLNELGNASSHDVYLVTIQPRDKGHTYTYQRLEFTVFVPESTILTYCIINILVL